MCGAIRKTSSGNKFFVLGAIYIYIYIYIDVYILRTSFVLLIYYFATDALLYQLARARGATACATFIEFAVTSMLATVQSRVRRGRNGWDFYGLTAVHRFIEFVVGAGIDLRRI